MIEEMRVFVSALLATCLAVPCAAQAPLAIRDIDGISRTPLVPAPGAVNVLFFVDVECPISNRYAPEIARIASDYAATHVQAFLVYAGTSDDLARVRAHLHDFYPSSAIPAILDAHFAITSAAGATITPEAAIYTARGRVYRGRIDDWYATLSQNRPAPTVHDVRRSLDAIVAGHAAPVPQTTAVGCYIARYGS